jgi:hypothetical protein
MKKRLIIECENDEAYSSILNMESKGGIKVIESLEDDKPDNTDAASGKPSEAVVDKLDDYKQRM